MTASAYRYKQKLDALFEKVDAIDDLELKSEWACYLCARTSGFVETSVESILSEYAEEKSTSEVANYVASTLERFTSANRANIAAVLRRFDESWTSQFEERMTGSLPGSLNSVISNRHRIAHGDDVSLSYVRMKDFYVDVVEVVKIIGDICSVD